MRTLTTHHDGHGLNETITIDADEPDESGASHRYSMTMPASSGGLDLVGTMGFQRGPRNAPGSIQGITEAAVLAVLIDRIEGFQLGPMRCFENAQMLFHLKNALRITKLRADERAARGVLGTNEP